MKILVASLIVCLGLIAYVYCQEKDDSSTKQHDANEEKHIIFEGEGEKFVNSTDDDVTLRQFYRPGGNFRPSYNHRVNAPIRPGRFNNIAPPSPYRPKPFPGPSQAFNGEHIYNGAFSRPSGYRQNNYGPLPYPPQAPPPHPSEVVPPHHHLPIPPLYPSQAPPRYPPPVAGRPGQFSNVVPHSNQFNYGTSGDPYVSFQSVGPNGRPAVTYLSPNFGFYFRNKNAVAESMPESDNIVYGNDVEEPVTSDIKFDSQR